MHRFEAALRLLDERCRVYQYLVKRTIDPIVPARCAQPVPAEAIRQRAAYLNRRQDDLYELALYLVLLYEAPATRCAGTTWRDLFRKPTEALHGWLSARHTIAPLETELDRAIATQADASRCRSATSASSASGRLRPFASSDSC